MMRPKSKSQDALSIYIPPPLRAKKPSTGPNDLECSAVLDQPKVSREYCPREITANNSSIKSKKCENSYLLFDSSVKKSCRPKKTSTGSAPAPSIQSGSKSKLKAVSPKGCPQKKCDNSYLLFTSNDNKPSSFKNPYISPKKTLPPMSHTKDPEKNDTSHEMLCKIQSDPCKPNETNGNVLDVQPINLVAKETTSIKDQREHLVIKETVNKDSPEHNHSTSVMAEVLDNISAKESSTADPKDVQVSASISLPSNNNPSVVSCLPCGVEMLEINMLDSTTNDIRPPENVASPLGLESFDNIEDYIVEIYDFPKTFKTQDLINSFSVYANDGFHIKWVDDCHAIGVFSNPFVVSEVLKKSFPIIKVRHMKNATASTVELAGTIPIPAASRPKTCPSLARRLVSGALGLRVAVSDKVRQAERKILQEAKEERRLAARQREEAWEGTLKSNMGDN